MQVSMQTADCPTPLQMSHIHCAKTGLAPCIPVTCPSDHPQHCIAALRAQILKDTLRFVLAVKDLVQIQAMSPEAGTRVSITLPCLKADRAFIRTQVVL